MQEGTVRLGLLCGCFRATRFLLVHAEKMLERQYYRESFESQLRFDNNVSSQRKNPRSHLNSAGYPGEIRAAVPGDTIHYHGSTFTSILPEGERHYWRAVCDDPSGGGFGAVARALGDGQSVIPALLRGKNGQAIAGATGSYGGVEGSEVITDADFTDLDDADKEAIAERGFGGLENAHNYISSSREVAVRVRFKESVPTSTRWETRMHVIAVGVPVMSTIEDVIDKVRKFNRSPYLCQRPFSLSIVSGDYPVAKDEREARRAFPGRALKGSDVLAVVCREQLIETNFTCLTFDAVDLSFDHIEHELVADEQNMFTNLGSTVEDKDKGAPLLTREDSDCPSELVGTFGHASITITRNTGTGFESTATDRELQPHLGPGSTTISESYLNQDDTVSSFGMKESNLSYGTRTSRSRQFVSSSATNLTLSGDAENKHPSRAPDALNTLGAQELMRLKLKDWRFDELTEEDFVGTARDSNAKDGSYKNITDNRLTDLSLAQSEDRLPRIQHSPSKLFNFGRL